MANHASTRTTQLYDRRREELSLDEVERISQGVTPSNPRNQIRCPYCSKFFPKSETDVDHVIASVWYPTNVPPTFQRYTVRACCGATGDWEKSRRIYSTTLLAVLIHKIQRLDLKAA